MRRRETRGRPGVGYTGVTSPPHLDSYPAGGGKFPATCWAGSRAGNGALRPTRGKDLAASSRRLPADCKTQPGRADCRRFISTSCQDPIQCRSTDRRPRVQSRKLPSVCQVCTRIGSLHCCLGESATLAAFSSLLMDSAAPFLPACLRFALSSTDRLPSSDSRLSRNERRLESV